MGDLSRGQMLQKVAQSALKLSGYEGTSFYNFEQIADKKAFKDKYRQALNELAIDDITAEGIVAEVLNAFGFNLREHPVRCKNLDSPDSPHLPHPPLHWRATQWFFYYLVSSLIWI